MQDHCRISASTTSDTYLWSCGESARRWFSSAGVFSFSSLKERRSASQEKRCPRGRNNVQTVIRLTTTVPPFSTNKFRELRLVMHTADSTCINLVLKPMVKQRKIARVIPNATLTSPSVENA